MISAVAGLMWGGVTRAFDALLPTKLVAPVLVAVVALGVSGPVLAQDSVELSRLSLEELLNVEVTSVSRRGQPLASAPAAIFVITHDDIQRSGLSSLPEILRLAPGVQVSRYSNSKWAVSARGMGVYYSNKLLVLIDGRSVYTPDFAGVYWDLHDMPADDIDRIEVVRGPGGTLWGANAVNGVINVITRPAGDTQGAQLSLRAGSEDRGTVTARYGGTTAGGTTYRVSGRVADHRFTTADPLEDTARLARGGFRLDRASGRDTWMLEGSAFTGREHAPVSVPVLTPPYLDVFSDSVELGGASVQGRWTRTFADGDRFVVSAYLDDFARNIFAREFHADAYDADVQYQTHLGGGHDLVAGAEYRYTHTTITALRPDLITHEPPVNGRSLLSAYGQDQIALTPSLTVIVGAKLEHHETVGRAFEPNVRTMWTLPARQRVWGAVSRGVRTPSLAEQQMNVRYTVNPPSSATLGLPLEVTIAGTDDAELETVTAYEAGYRVQPLGSVAVDVALFRNEYDHLSSYERRQPSLAVLNGIRYLTFAAPHEYLAKGHTQGLEATATWTPSQRWTLSGSATVLRANFTVAKPALDVGASLLVLQQTPRQQFVVRSSVQVTPTVGADVSYFYQGRWLTGQIAPYSRVDARAGWEPLGGRLRLEAGVQNLFDDRHVETMTYLYETAVEIPRSAFISLAWSFQGAR